MRKSLLTLLLLGGAAAAGEPKKVVTVEGITEYTLDNGLRVLLFPDDSKPTVTVNATYFVGSRHEGYGESGMAHLLEHMLFKGTPRHPKIWHELDQHGARFNGSTWYDRTNYFETLESTDANLEWAIDMEADRMVSSRVSKEDLASEFSVVRNEFEIGENNPSEVLEERLYSTAYLWHNYGKATIGSKSDIEHVPVDALQAFYRRFYQPDNAMLVVAGKIDPQKTLALVQKTFGKIPRPARKLAPTYTVEPVQDGERTVTLRRTGDVSLVGVVYHGAAGSDPDFVAEEAIADILTHKPTGRLYKALVDKGLASRVEADTLGLAEPGLMKFEAEVVRGKSVELVRDTLLRTIEELAQGKIDPVELTRFQTSMLKRIELRLTDAGRIGVELSEWGAEGDWRLIFLHRDAVRALDVARVQRVAAAYLRPSNRTVGLFLPDKAPERAPLPGRPDVASMVKSYKGLAAVAKGEAFEATLANIDKRTERLTLPSGMKLALLPKKTRGAAVKMLFKINAGSEKALKGITTAVGMIPEMVLRGTKRHSYQQLRDELDRLKAEIAPAGGGALFRPGAAAFNLTTVRDSVPDVLALLAEMAREPSFPKEEFDKLRQERLARLQDSLQQPQALGFTTLYQKAQPYPPDDVRYRPTIKESIERLKSVKLEQLVAFHKNHWGAAEAELVLVGDFDPAAVKEVVSRELGAWRAKRGYQRIALPYRPASVADETIVTPDKQNAMVGLATSFAVRDDDPEYPALEMIDFIYGGSFKSRLIERLRQKDGLSYGTFSSIASDAFDKNAVFSAFAFCAPQNANKAMAAMLEELSTLVKKGVSADELKEAKTAYKARFDTQLTGDGFVAALLEESLEVGRKLDFYDKLVREVLALSPETVATALRKYVRPDALVKVKAGDIKN